MRILEYLLDHTPRFQVRPVAFGTFHLIAVGIILGLFVFMVIFRRRLPRGERALRRSLIIFGVGLLLMEIGKQITYSYTPGVGWVYNWNRFPFQFCSIPIYAALVGMCLPACRARQAILSFLATYSPVAGCAVLFYPAADVFHEIVFLNLHTMLWHGAMLLYGLYLWLSEAVLPTRQTSLGAAIVYIPMPVVALLLNEWEHMTDFAGDYIFNLFYISRHGDCMIPVLSWVQDHAPYAVFFLAYVALLGLGGGLVTVGMWCVRTVSGRMSSKRGNPVLSPLEEETR